MNEDHAKEMLNAMDRNGAEYPLHLYTSSPVIGQLWMRTRPGVVVHLYPQELLPIDTKAVLISEKDIKHEL